MLLFIAPTPAATDVIYTQVKVDSGGLTSGGGAPEGVQAKSYLHSLGCQNTISFPRVKQNLIFREVYVRFVRN